MVVDRVHPRKYPNSSVFRDVSWNFYKAMLREFDEQPSRINYDRGTLEVMTLPIEHERFKSVIGSMVVFLAMAFQTRLRQGGSSTLKRISKQKGLEADQCYWIANEAAMRGVKRINLRNDPPPDLVIEIDVMHSVVNREGIYAALGVPEMWVLRRNTDGYGLSAFELSEGIWKAVERSKAFPSVRVADLNPFIARIDVDDDTTLLADFSAWATKAAKSNA